jgi:o-succinylbenzoate synthase
MKIKHIEVFHVDIPLLYHFETSFGIIDKRPFLIIKMTDEFGNIGYGESSPLYVPISENEVLDDGVSMMKEKLPIFLNKDFSNKDDFYNLFFDIQNNNVNRLGIEGAFLDLYNKNKKILLNKYFGDTQNKILIGESVGILDTVEDTINKVQKYVDCGSKRIKLKVKKGHDIEIISEVRSMFPNISLGIDANSGYSKKEYYHVKSFDKFGLMFIEQPFQKEDFELHAKLKKEISTPICLDESIYSIDSCKKALKMEACDIVNIKPARIGSYKDAVEIHEMCYSKKIPMFGGGRMESSIGRFFNASLYCLPGFSLPSDMTSPSCYFSKDLTENIFFVKNGEFKFDDNFENMSDIISEKNLKEFTKNYYSFKL